MKISKKKIRFLIKESLGKLISEMSEDLEETFEEEESHPETPAGSDTLYVFDFDDCLVDSSSRRGLAPAEKGRPIKSKPGEFKWKQVKDANGNGFYYAWMRSVDYDKFKKKHGGKRPNNVKSRDSRFQSVKDFDTYTVADKQGSPLKTVTISSKLIPGTVAAYRNAISQGSKVIILTSRMNNRSGKNDPTIRRFLQSKAGISNDNIEPYFAVNLSTTKGQRLLSILNSPGFENIENVVIYEDNIDKLMDMKNTAISIGKSAEAILVVGNEDISSRSHPAIADGNVIYTYQRV